MNKKANNTKQILKVIGCDKLSLVRVVGSAYWYFCYDDIENNVYETESVYTPRLNDMTVAQWAEIGKGLVEKVKNNPNFPI